ncbi:hypothetical protein T459_35531 [Capsicum annuum]|uniref:Uncharacterized protein n=1 Tax=Capsicum annuum TaxID=4072 RepID=A0A2G2XJ24_CAPAN|nr:hypothetical protein T459_35531 [Capsicum annuum]
MAFNDSNTEVADMVKSHLDSKLPVLSVEDTIPKSEFHSPGAPIGSLPLVLRINDCKWVDTGQLSDSFDKHQYNQIKLLGKKFDTGRPLARHSGVYLKDYYLLAICCYLTNWIDIVQELLDVLGCAPLLINPLSSSSDAPKLFDKMDERSRWLSMLHDSEHLGEVEVLIECSDNLTSFCDSYKLLGISLENSFLYSLDRFATSRVERYEIDQFRHVRANCRRDISVERCKIGNFTRQMNLELVISQPAQILEWIDSLKGWMSLSPQQEQVEGILMLVGQIEGFSDYNYDSCMVYVPNGKFLSSIGPTVVKYWERYTGPVLVKEWRKHLDIILPM